MKEVPLARKSKLKNLLQFVAEGNSRTGWSAVILVGRSVLFRHTSNTTCTTLRLFPYVSPISPSYYGTKIIRLVKTIANRLNVLNGTLQFRQLCRLFNAGDHLCSPSTSYYTNLVLTTDPLTSRTM